MTLLVSTIANLVEDTNIFHLHGNCIRSTKLEIRETTDIAPLLFWKSQKTNTEARQLHCSWCEKCISFWALSPPSVTLLIAVARIAWVSYLAFLHVPDLALMPSWFYSHAPLTPFALECPPPPRSYPSGLRQNLSDFSITPQSDLIPPV